MIIEEMPTFFLDIDGVLNSDESAYLYRNLPIPLCWRDLRCVERINKLIKELNANLVISSCWRLGETRESLTKMLHEIGIEYDALADRTGPEIEDKNHNNLREEEIKLYLKERPEIKRFVIIDDDDYGWRELRDKWVWVDSHLGLQDVDIEKAKRILEK